MNQNFLFSTLKQRGHRLSKARKNLITLFTTHKTPLSIIEMSDYLESLNQPADKTTIYRELDFLLAQNIIKELDFAEGKKRYELADLAHHHHLICTECKQVDAIHFDEELAKEETLILKQKGFKVTNHMLEFFGLCQKCRDMV